MKISALRPVYGIPKLWRVFHSVKEVEVRRSGGHLRAAAADKRQ